MQLPKTSLNCFTSFTNVFSDAKTLLSHIFNTPQNSSGRLYSFSRLRKIRSYIHDMERSEAQHTLIRRHSHYKCESDFPRSTGDQVQCWRVEGIFIKNKHQESKEQNLKHKITEQKQKKKGITHKEPYKQQTTDSQCHNARKNQNILI